MVGSNDRRRPSDLCHQRSPPMIVAQNHNGSRTDFSKLVSLTEELLIRLPGRNSITARESGEWDCDDLVDAILILDDRA